MQKSNPGRIEWARSSRDAEERLAKSVLAHQQGLVSDLQTLRLPFLIVVPSETLRQHVLSALVRRTSGSLLGIRVLPPLSLAREILERAGHVDSGRPGDLVLEILARRHARDEPLIQQVLDPFEDGYGGAVATVRDLLSAGLGSTLRLPSELEIDQRFGACSNRTRALLRTAERTQKSLMEARAPRSADRLRTAAQVLRANPGLLTAAGVSLYGFADATEPILELLRALLQLPSSGAILEAPPDPMREDLSSEPRFVNRFAERLGVSPFQGTGQDTPALPSVRVIFALTPRDEVRWVAKSIRDLLDRGVEPEGIGIVCRNLDRYTAGLRIEIPALGVPASGGSAKSGLFPWFREAKALLQIMEMGSEASIDTWLEAQSCTPFVRGPSGSEAKIYLQDLGLALRSLGCLDLKDVAGLDESELGGTNDRIMLPVQSAPPAEAKTQADEPGDGPFEPPEEAQAGSRRSRERSIPKSVAREGRRATLELIAAYDAWPDQADFPTHALAAKALIACLHSDAESGGAIILQEIIETLHAVEIPDFKLSRAEFVASVQRALARRHSQGQSGKGAGVRVTDVLHARGQTFDHLFVLGLQSDLFPRTIVEDALLPDRERRLLLQHLPGLALKSYGHDEEVHLFRQLMFAASEVTLLASKRSPEGKPLTESPFLERLLRAQASIRISMAPSVYDELPLRAAGGEAPWLTTREAAFQAALARDRDALRGLLAEVLFEGAHRFGIKREIGHQRLSAKARVDFLAEVDPDLSTPEGRARQRCPGPLLGALGRNSNPGSSSSPRDRIAVTTLERYAACPWQMHLERHLKLEPVPDPGTELPMIPNDVIGTTAHAILEELLRKSYRKCSSRESPRFLEEALRAGPVLLGRPESDEVLSTVKSAGALAARAAGLRIGWLIDALIERCRVLVTRALDQDWPNGDSVVPVLGVEVEGEVRFVARSGQSVAIMFRADRADLVDSGVGGTILRLTDYKTGKPPSHRSKKSTPDATVVPRKDILGGRMLQGSAYAGSSAIPCVGRYLYLGGDTTVGPVVMEVPSTDTELSLAFRGTAEALISGLKARVHFPRVRNAKGIRPEACNYCTLKDACSIGDSGFHRRLEALATPPFPEDEAVPEFLFHLRRLWNLENSAPLPPEEAT